MRTTRPNTLISVSSFIVVLAIEVILAWQVLRYSPGTINVDLLVPCRGEAQLLVDVGAGFSHQVSKRFPVEAGENRLNMTIPPGPMVALKLAPPACAGRFTVLALRASGRWRQTSWRGETIRSRVTRVGGAILKESSQAAEFVVVGANPSVILRAPGGITKQFARIFWSQLLGLLLVTAVGLALVYRFLWQDGRRASLLRRARELRQALAAFLRQLPPLIALRFLAVTGIVSWMGYQLLPRAWAAYGSSSEQAIAFGRAVASGSFEQRRVRTYGDCGNMGYGYVTSVLHAYPRIDSRPIIRYADYDRPLELLLPGWRTNVDQNVLIGIGISEDDFHERLIANAQRRHESRQNGTTLSRWTFQTALDYELMSRVELSFGPAPLPAARAVELALIESPTRDNLLGSWSIQVPAGQSGPYSFVLPSPLRRFSKTRGATDFIFAVKETGESSLESIGVYGAKVDGAGFTTVNRRESCLVAVQQELLSRVRSNPHDPWARFINAVRNVPLP